MGENSDLAVYVFYYQNGIIPFIDPSYHAILAGKALCNDSTEMAGDDTGNSISTKNPYYSELTGIYWIWKNTCQAITGCCHYRRYFTLSPVPYLHRLKRFGYRFIGIYKKRYGLIYTDRIKDFVPKILSSGEIQMLLKEYDAILPVQRKLKYSVKTQFKRYHNIRDIEIIEEIIREKYPDYLPDFQKVLNGKRLYANNIFILPRNLFEEFVKWWFDLLFEFENRIQLSGYSGYQKRIMGFVAERLLTTWFYHQPIRIKELEVIYFKKLKSFR